MSRTVELSYDALVAAIKKGYLKRPKDGSKSLAEALGGLPTRQLELIIKENPELVKLYNSVHNIGSKTDVTLVLVGKPTGAPVKEPEVAKEDVATDVPKEKKAAASKKKSAKKEEEEVVVKVMKAADPKPEAQTPTVDPNQKVLFEEEEEGFEEEEEEEEEGMEFGEDDDEFGDL